MARPRKTLTEEQIAEVDTLAAVLSLDQMADYFGMARNTFSEICKRNNGVFERYKKGRAKAVGVVAKGLLMRAREGDTASAIFYLKTQAGWRETQTLDHTSSDKSMSTNNIESMTDEQLDAETDRLIAKMDEKK